MSTNREPDFMGWATKNDIKCADGRIIRRDAFAEMDGVKVPLVYQHNHTDSNNVLGHAILENRPEGVYAYGYFNDTDAGRNAKIVVKHGDLDSLSIYANNLKHKGCEVIHGVIRELSLVLAGANPKAKIDWVISHSIYDNEEGDEELYISGVDNVELSHSEEEEAVENDIDTITDDEELEHAEPEGDKVEDVFNTLNEKQKNLFYYAIGQAINKYKGSNNDEEENTNMKHNIFDQDYEDTTDVLQHSEEELMAVITDAKRYGSMRESALQHGITNIEYLFPDAKNVTREPIFIQRDMGWVSKVMNGVHHTPFSRIRSLFADITEDEARAKGYIKGKMKKEEVFSLLKRTTDPQTIYKKQKLHRDDVIDITDFDVISWLKTEMRMMLDEEIARAIFISDGRVAGDDKIDETHIRPIIKDDALYTIQAKVKVTAAMTDNQKAKAIIRSIIKSRKDYKGSGTPTFFTSEDILTELLLIENENGEMIYTLEKLKTVLRVSDIITVPVFEGATGKDGGDLVGVIVNLSDYNVGADKGGAVNMFDDFDIDYNAQKYLIETRLSGALIKPYSAIAIEFEETT